MTYLVVCVVALVVSGLTFFSGFGLGTLLLPAFAVFFPLPVAVAASAVVHLATNLFKVALVGRRADWGVVLRFALPGAPAALAGAALLTAFVGLRPLAAYQLAGEIHHVTIVKVAVAVLIVAFACFEMIPRLAGFSFNRRHLVLGGALSGFFGGLSGHQGALRSAFLIKAGLDKEAFIGTGAVAAVIVDAARLAVYGAGFYAGSLGRLGSGALGPVVAASAAAFAGAFLGARLVPRLSLRAVQVIVGAMLFLVAGALGTGLV